MKSPKIYVATKARGIFKYLFTSKDIDAEFVVNNASLVDFTKKSSIYKIFSKVFYSGLFDKLGIIQVINVERKDADFYWSYNRFLHTDKPYILYIEHPIALQHYRINRGKSLIGRKVIKNSLNDANLAAIVFQAKFSEKTFAELIGPYKGIKKQIYPCVQINKYVTEEVIKERSYQEKIQLLFVAQGKRFISKGGLELINAYQRLTEAYGNKIQLSIVTNISDIDSGYINSDKQIQWIDYKLTKDEMEQLYAKSNILVVVSSDDSLNAVAMEALKAGVAIVSSNMAGFPEIVEQDVNGYLTDPKWQFFDKQCFPNEKVWNHRKETIYSTEISDRIVDFIYSSVKKMVDHREILERLSMGSWKKAKAEPFSEEYIIDQWNDLLREICEK